MTQLLQNKSTVAYGAGGGIGGGVARTFAQEGARVFLAGRTRSSREAVAGERCPARPGSSAMISLLDRR